MPNTSIEIELHLNSSPSLLAVATANNGHASTRFRIPKNVEGRTHELEVMAVRVDGRG